MGYTSAVTMRRILLTTVSALALTCGSQAQAADKDFTAVHDWRGLYVGAHAGYVRGETDFPTAVAPNSVKPDGFFAGGQFGYNWQHDNIVYGPFVSTSGFFADDTGAPGGVATKVLLEWSAAFGGKAGYAVDNWLPFVFAGLVVEESEVRRGGVIKDSAHVGFTVGAGIDYAIRENWSVGVQYAYKDMGRRKINLVPPMRVGFTSHSARFNVNYHF